MVLWIAMAALAAAVALPLLVALNRAPAAGGGRRERAIAIYRDQLEELGREVDRGVVAKGEAAAARTEISRRLIHAGEGGPPGASALSSSPSLRRIAAAVIVAMPIAAVALYVVLGSPGLPDAPLAARLAAPPDTQDIAALVKRVEEHLATAPEDGHGWEVLAPVYQRLGRAADAATAYGNALRILGSSASLEAGLGESLVGVSGGVVTADARAAFERAVALAPDDPRPRFFLAVALDQDGKTDEAIAAWKALLAGAPADAPWVAVAQGELARLQQASATSPEATPGPSTDDIAAASDLSPEERSAMIEGMVASLATRLESEPGDAEGWARLIRSYAVLDRMDDARNALTKARLAVADDAGKAAVVEQAARAAGLAQ